MSPGELLLKIGEIALRLGPEIAKAWTTIEQSLRAEVPELDQRPLPTEDVAAEQARAEGLRNQRLEELRRRSEIAGRDPEATPIVELDGPPVWACDYCGTRFGTAIRKCYCGGEVRRLS